VRGETSLVLSVIFGLAAGVFASLGLLGEMVTRTYHEGGSRRPYVVRRTAGFPDGTADGDDQAPTIVLLDTLEGPAAHLELAPDLT
jgi:hypothetical protein